MKIYSKLLSKIQNNKARVKKVVGIVSVAVGLRYGKINPISASLWSNSTQQVEQVQNYVEEDIQVIDTDGKVIKTGSVILIGNQQISEGSKSALIIRSGDGDLGKSKSGPGARAKAAARRNFNKKSGSSIIPGASGYTPQHIYRIYKESGRLKAPTTKIDTGVPNFNDGVPPRIVPSVSPNRQGRIKSQPLRIKSKHQKTDVMITKKDVKKWMTPEQRQETSNQKINEQRVQDKFVDTVKKPNEVLDGIHIHREQKNCKVYIKDIETSDGTQKKLALIADTETGRPYLGSTLTEQEYLNLKKTGEIDLSDLRRDPQTLVMNQKSIQEAEALSQAKDEGCLTEFTDIRRPYNVSESLTDFVGKDSMGSKINFDIKGIDGSGRRPLDRQTQDINQNIKDLFDGADDPTKFQIICDISSAPTFLQKTIIKNITQGFDSNQLKNINFLF